MIPAQEAGIDVTMFNRLQGYTGQPTLKVNEIIQRIQLSLENCTFK
jgi:hypothetical protein